LIAVAQKIPAVEGFVAGHDGVRRLAERDSGLRAPRAKLQNR
jgi:hypothetical protein